MTQLALALVGFSATEQNYPPMQSHTHREASAPTVAQLYREHRDFVARTVQRLTGSGAHVEDLTQEVFLTAHRKCAQFDPRRSLPSTWLYSITRHLCMRHRRGANRFAAFQERLQHQVEVEPAGDGLEHTVGLAQQKAAVAVAIDKLSFKHREVFVMYELEEMQGPAIAELLDIPEGTVWTRLHHARRGFDKHMRRLLGENTP